MKSQYLRLKSHATIARVLLGFLLLAIIGIGWAIHRISGSLTQPQQAAGGSGSRAASPNLPPVNSATVEPRLSEFMRLYRLGPKAAKYLAQARTQILEQTDTSVHLSIAFPDKFTIDETATAAADPNFTPSPADLEWSARTGRNVHGAKLTFKDQGPNAWMSTLEYHLPYSAVPRELLKKIQPPSTKASAGLFVGLISEARADDGGELTGEMVISVIANYTSEAYKGLDPAKVAEFKELEEGLEKDNLKSLGADAPLALVDAFEDYLKWQEWNDKMAKVVDCAKHPTNPLSQKASQDPNYQHDVLDQVDAAGSDMFWSFAPQAASDVAGYISHFLPFFGGGVVVGVIFSTQDAAVDQWADGRIDEAAKYVVPCGDKAPGRKGALEFTYTLQEGVPGNQRTVSGKASGSFDFGRDPLGAPVYAGKGDANLEWIETNKTFVNQAHYHLGGPLEIFATGRGSPRDATVKVTFHGEELQSIRACAGSCSTGSTDTFEHAGFTRTCVFNEVDLVRGGAFAGILEPPDEHATCKVTFAGD